MDTRLATYAKFVSFVISAGLGFYPIGRDPVEIMSYMVRNPSLVARINSLLVDGFFFNRSELRWPRS